MMSQFLSVALGGAVGACLRFSLTLVFPFVPGKLPIASLLANVSGCFIMGAVYFLLQNAHLPPSLRPLIVGGFLGALTTFSTFALEAWLLLQHNAPLLALAHMSINVVACVLAVALGHQALAMWLKSS